MTSRWVTASNCSSRTTMSAGTSRGARRRPGPMKYSIPMSLLLSASYRVMDSVTARLDYGRSTWRFITSHFRDREEDQLAGAVFYRVLPKASVFIEYGHRKIDYAEETLDLDSTVGTMQAGLTWDFSSRSKGTLKAGLARKDFTSSARSNGTVKVGSADVRHDFATNTTVVLTAQRSMNEPNIPGIDYFISTGAYAELTQRFVQKWAAVVRVAYVQDQYSIRTDRTALSGAGLRYRAKDWLEFALDYNWNKRQSNIEGNDYTEQSSIITVNVSHVRVCPDGPPRGGDWPELDVSSASDLHWRPASM